MSLQPPFAPAHRAIHDVRVSANVLANILAISGSLPRIEATESIK